MTERQKKLRHLFMSLGSNFLNRESNRDSLITITDASVAPDLSRVKLFFTVLPEEKETAALDFVKRKRSELRELVKKQANLKRIPTLDFEVDRGEKHRQHIDELHLDNKND